MNPSPLSRISFLMTVILVFSNCTVKKNVFLAKENKAKNEITLPYNIFYPDSYAKGEKVPLLIFLHGAGERGKDNKSQLIHVAPYLTNLEIRTKFPAVLLFPQCPEEDYWVPVKRFEWSLENSGKVTPAMSAVISLLEDVIKDKNIDQNRIYVAGLSMGGFGTLDLISRKPELFAAAVPICGGADLEKASNYAHLPLWIFHGAKDDVVRVTLSRDLYKTLKAIGSPVKYTEYPEGGHNVWDEAILEPELLPWLFSQSKNK
ncbi:MAG: prolyl oligopeptidase family serine peptidase [Saprospiraceae bacterium]|nr:prolyl oligopeptidase family serine peptidase [Saprospiraceae bacterium]